MARGSPFTLRWASIAALLCSAFFAYDSVLALPTDRPVKAALVALVKDNDIDATLSSIKQFEDKFNNRYLHDWVFFSVEDLSEDFKEKTSNATNATCIFEVVPKENWNAAGWAKLSQKCILQDVKIDHDPSALKAIANIRQMKRWNSAPFAKEKRLGYYEWFLRVQPGAQLAQNIPFDVFRFMRDNGIAYGSSRAALGRARLPHLSPRIKSFVDKHSGFLHQETDVAWLIENDTGILTQTNSLDEGFEDLVDEGSDELRSRTKTVSIDEAQDEGEASSWLSECFASWLADILGNSLFPYFEIGSLAFFRSPSHAAFFDHLDNAGDLQFRRVNDAPIHSLSENMFFPRESVWNFRTMETKLRSQHGDEQSRSERLLDSEKCMINLDKSNLNSSVKKGDAHDAMVALLQSWDLMARDVGAQSKSPKLLSGNTWMGKTNGGAGCSFIWFWRKTLSDDLGFGWKVDLSCLDDGMKGQVKINV
ncbi:hypothetical protein LB507_003416, partial [Fusarium sp. FIESC RH6]